MRIRKVLSLFLLIFAFSFILIGCGEEDNTPSESTLQSNGVSLQLALPTFKSLTTNYMYKE